MERLVLPRSGRARIVRAAAVAGMVLGGLAWGTVPDARAQFDDRVPRRPAVSDPRGDFSDQLLESLIETEREYRSERRYDPGRPIDPATRPTGSVDLSRVRTIIDDFARGASRLSTTVEQELNRVPGLRNEWDDVLKIRARSNVLADRTRTARDIAEIQADIAALDRDWRDLSYQLQQVRGLDRNILEQVQTLDQTADALTKRMSIAPQLNHYELLRQTATLSADLHNLVEDIELELGHSPLQNDLLLAGRKLQHQARRVSMTVADGAEYDTIVAEYRLFQSDWQRLATQLRSVENNYIERTVRRVRNVDQTIHELLWLPHDVDRGQLLHLAELLKRDVDEFFVRAPLKLLIALPDPSAVLPTAGEFYGVCEHFIDEVNNNASMDILIKDYGHITEAWHRFDATFGPLQSQAAQQVLAQIEQSVYSLRDALQIEGGYDRRNVIELAASLENLAGHLDLTVQRWLTHDRPSYRSAALRESESFAIATQQFHQLLLSGTGPESLRRDVSDLYDRWRVVYDHVSRCQTQDRDDLAQLARRITPALVELRTLLAP